MNPQQASLTAMGTSLMRALHTRHDPAPLIDDAWGDRLVPDAVRAGLLQRALAGLDPAARSAAAAAPAQAAGRLMRANPSYADVITRTRYAEDALRAAAGRGVTQYVILGAGFDSFAYRRPDWAAGLAVFEIDHPATQAIKRQRLAECGVDATGLVDFIAADLSAEGLATALGRSAYDPARLTFVSWLGVTMYLSAEANRAALEAIAASMPAGSELVFNYLDGALLRAAAPADAAFAKLKADVASAGEPFLSGFDPAGLGETLRAAGLSLLEDLNGEQVMARYDPTNVNCLPYAAAAHLAHVAVSEIPNKPISAA